MKPALSVLDLVPVREGGTVEDAFSATTELAQSAERFGYKRFWVAEHHALNGVAGGATSVVLAHLGNATSTIRIGAGGIMLPNHTPFQIAEQFGTLGALFPGRIDLGLGRASGAGPELQRALRKNLNQAAEMFPQDVVELQALLTGDLNLAVTATPGLGTQLEMWMLGSSLFGAKLAARLGLPYAFASHFAPTHLDEALALYRREFTPSAWLDAPHVMVAMNVFAADSERDAEKLASSQLQSFIRLRSGDPGRLPAPVEGFRDQLPNTSQAIIDHLSVASAIGTPRMIREEITSFCQATQADELILAGATFDPQDRIRTLQTVAEVLDGPGAI